MSDKENSVVMDPEESPGTVSKPGGRRVNSRPLLILVVIVLAFVGVMGMVAADRADKQHETKNKPEAAGSSDALAKSAVDGMPNGLIPAEIKPVATTPSDQPPTPPGKPVLIARPTGADQPPTPPQNLQEPKEDPEAQQIRQEKMQLLMTAIKAKSEVSFSKPTVAQQHAPSAGQPIGQDDIANKLADLNQQIADEQATNPTGAYQASLAKARAIAAGMGGGSSSAPHLMHTSGNSPSQSAYQQFDNSGAGDRWRLDSKVEPPRSTYELRAGFVIPGTLISGINSELPGQIVAQVSQNVYDTATGKYLLVPQGSRLVGAYSSNVAYGQSRVLVAWQRIVFPDGKAMDIGSMPGSSGAGYSGLHDQVDNHYFRIFGSALLMSLVSEGVSY
jgi:type IV secretory pathway VirB10-like protein